MYVLTALSQTLHLDLVRRGKGREGRMENVEKCKRMRERREGKTKEERSRENKREKKGEKRERSDIPLILILQFKHCLKDVFRCIYWLNFFHLTASR